jgi:AcrR family transcriptional regulator
VASDADGPTEAPESVRDARLLGEAMQRRRSTLPPEELRRRYIELGELVLLQQIRAEAEEIDGSDVATPLAAFARLDAGEVARRVGKTRGSITNLFGSQASFQAATMLFGFSDFEDMGGVREVEFPAPVAFPDPESWLEALAHVESARGPHRGRELTGYAARWTLWASLLPYAVWSARIADESTSEFENWTRWILRSLLEPALAHFGCEIVPPYQSHDLALAMAHTVEGLWLSQAVTSRYTVGDGMTPERAATNALTMLWRGATGPAASRS